jgi:hypothetical protein
MRGARYERLISWTLHSGSKQTGSCPYLVPIRIVDEQFYSCQHFEALAAPATKYCASVEAQTGGGSSLKGGFASSAS